MSASNEPTPTVRLSEWTTTGTAENPALANCRRLTSEEAAQAAWLTKRRRVEVLETPGGLRVTTRSFVGVVPLGPVTLSIRPRIAELDAAAMAALLRYALGMNAVDRQYDDAAAVPLADAGFVDLIALLLLDVVNELLRAGLLRDYQPIARWLASPRGKLDVGELARHPARLPATLTLPCRYEQRTTDNVFNRLAWATLDALRRQVTDTGIAFDLQSRAALLGELCVAEPLSSQMLRAATAALDRRSFYYKPLIEIADLVLSGLGTTVGDGARQTAAFDGFLLDMNPLFERFVARLLTEFGPPHLQVAPQQSDTSAYAWTHSPFGWRRPRLRPDLVITEAASGLPRLVLDTKYKPLGPGHPPQSADLYQLTIYALALGTAGRSIPARIVYPATSGLPQKPPLLRFDGNLGTRNAHATIDFAALSLRTVCDALRRDDADILRKAALDLVAL